jgi:muramoyltetrapeptide carboxypeptidase LdcA involved in peptidoglycan recycling
VTEPVVLHSFVPEKQTDSTAFATAATEPVPATDAKTTDRPAQLVPAEKGENIHLEGRLIGGCMDCLVNLLGTSFDHVAEFNERYQNGKIIWFMEACDLNLMSIRRGIWQMKHAGWFQNLAGFLIGRPLCFGEEAFGIDQYRAVTDLLAEYGVPVIMDMDIGHLPPMMPLIVGATAAVDVKGNEVSITYTWK